MHANQVGSIYNIGSGTNQFQDSRELKGLMYGTTYVDGLALSPNAFGYGNNGEWAFKRYNGDYGVNGFELLYNSGSLGTDSSGNNNHFDVINESSLASIDIV